MLQDMGADVKYSVDTSVLIDAWLGYPPDIFPGIWSRVDGLIEDGDLAATQVVLWELGKQEDTLHEWAKEREQRLFVAVDEQIQVTVQEIISQFPKAVSLTAYRPEEADLFVIALAKIEGCAVVAHEKSVRNPQHPRMPDICSGLGVTCLRLFDMFRQENWQF